MGGAGEVTAGAAAASVNWSADPTPRALFDVGNSRIKAAVFDGELWRCTACASPNAAWLRATLGALPPQRLAVSSVHPHRLSRLLLALSKRKLPAPRAFASNGGLFRLGVLKSGVDTPESTGADRILGAFAARRRAAGGAVLMVGCGTAMTVNVVDADGVFRGGAILPGLKMLADSLARNTAALPRVELTEWPTFPGASTAAALRAGIAAAAVGGLEKSIALLQAAVGPAKLFLGGGDAEFFAPHFPRATVAPHLVLEGLDLVAAEFPAP